MIDTAKHRRWLTVGHFVFGGMFIVIWGMQSCVFAVFLSDFIHSSVIGKIGLVSSICYAVLGIVWVSTGLLLRSGRHVALVRTLSMLGVLFFPFGVLLSVPTLVYLKRSAEAGVAPNGGPAAVPGNADVPGRRTD